MKKLTAAVILALLTATAATAATWEREPKEYRGVPFNTPEQDVRAIAKQLGITCNSNVCSSTKTTGSGLDTIVAHEEWLFQSTDRHHAHFVGVLVMFDSDHFDAMKSAMILMYGDPSATDHPAWISKVGGALTNEVLMWKGQNVSIKLTRYGPDVHRGTLNIRTNENWELLARLKAEGNHP